MSPSAPTLEMIQRFLSFETTSRGSNLPLIHWVADFLRGHGVESFLTYDESRQKANLLATVGPTNKPGLILSGHTDTVPVDGQAWTCNPFSLTQRGEFYLGRGITDMKGFLAIALAQVPQWLEQGLTRPIHFAMSYDEEVGCLGVPFLIADLKNRGIQASGCIVGEPSQMRVIRGHKGKIGVHVKVIGKEAHTGVPHLGVNAIEVAAEIISHVREVARRHREQGPFDPAFDAPPYTTLQTGLVRGGNAVNTVAGHCEFDFDLRYLPSVDPLRLVEEIQAMVAQRLLPEMRRVSTEAGVSWQLLPGCEALDTALEDPIVGLALQLSQTTGTSKVGFGTEAGYFQKAGIPTVLCGPGCIDQAHKPDEFVTAEQIVLCEQFMQRLGEHCR